MAFSSTTYTQRIQVDQEKDEDIKSEDDTEIKSSVAEKMAMLIDLWLLASGCLMPKLQNDCMKMIFPLFAHLEGEGLRDVAVRIYNADDKTGQLRRPSLNDSL